MQWVDNADNVLSNIFYLQYRPMLHGKCWTLAYVTDVRGQQKRSQWRRYPKHSRQWKWQMFNWGLNWTFATFIWNATEGQHPTIISTQDSVWAHQKYSIKHIKSGIRIEIPYTGLFPLWISHPSPLKTQNPSPTCNWISHFLPMFSTQIPNITTRKRQILYPAKHAQH